MLAESQFNGKSIIDWNTFPFIADGVGEAAFPVTALLGGALLTIVVAVLLIICLTIKKSREQSPPHENGIKEKHIGSTCVYFPEYLSKVPSFFRYGHNRNDSTRNERRTAEIRRCLHSEG